MITITRRLASQLKSVLHRALQVARGSGLKITFETDAAGVRVRAATENAAVEYQAAGEFPNERLCAPFDLLADVEACRDDRVELETTGDGRVLARWQDRGIPQTTQYQVAEGATTIFPAFPTSIKANPPRLLAALHDAMESTDDGAVRFATNCVQLRSDGSLVGTDGRQVLVQNGFEFPWKEDLLVARNSVFGSKELRLDQPVDIGNTDDWLSLRAGSWVLHFRLNKEGRFPKVADVIPSADTATTILRLFPADRDFLAQALKRLPCNDALNQPITVDLNGAVAIRAQPEDGRQVTELLLTGSERVGPPVCFNTNRKFLARALALGFQEILVFCPTSPVMCRDDTRRFLWAVLEPDGGIKPSKDAFRIESPGRDGTHPIPKKRNRKMAKKPSPDTTASGNGQPCQQTPVPAEPDVPATALTQAVELQAALRDAGTRAAELIRTLKREKKQSRLVKSALASLRELHTSLPAGATADR